MNKVFAIGVVLGLSGCALVRKGEPLRVRYFVPEAKTDAALSEGEPPSDAPRLRLGRVTGAAQLGQRMVAREGGEVRYQDGLRWTERPEVYLRRDLAAALFEGGRLRRVVAGPSPTLDVELVDFEERRGERHTAHFRAVVAVYGDRELWLERTIAEDVEVHGTGAEAVVDAFGEALARGVGKIASTTEQVLAAHAPEPGAEARTAAR